MNPILERSPAALYARSVFFEHSNDVDVYVEDTDEGAVKLYTILIQRALGNALHIDQVYPLGGFQRVLERCQSDQGLWGRLRIYLVDGDLRLIHRNGLVVLRRLVYLPRYSIENFLIDEEAAIELLYQEDPPIPATPYGVRWFFLSGLRKYATSWFDYSLGMRLHMLGNRRCRRSDLRLNTSYRTRVGRSIT